MQLLLKNVGDTKYLIQRSGAGSIPGASPGLRARLRRKYPTKI